MIVSPRWLTSFVMTEVRFGNAWSMKSDASDAVFRCESIASGVESPAVGAIACECSDVAPRNMLGLAYAPDSDTHLTQPTDDNDDSYDVGLS